MNDSTTRLERIPTLISNSEQEAVSRVADAIESLIRQRQQEGLSAVLGLATGSTPVPLYRELIRRHREQGLSFSNVVTFNLDEYYPISPEHPQSYHSFMRTQLFDHLDIPDAQIHIPRGDCLRDSVIAQCDAYDQAIRDAGGIDIQILGIGRTGHIGFNEPGSSVRSSTRLVTLDSLTRSDAAKDFLGEANVPRHAITMGVGTILAARQIFLLAWGRGKAEILQKAIEEAPQDSVPASFLQQHDRVSFCIDRAAAAELTRCKYPWLVSMPDWDAAMVRRAVTDLSLRLRKPLLRLVDKDYQENGLADLVTEEGPAYNLNIRVFNEVQHTITGWPGGKPNTDDSHRPERADPASKRVLILSPEPLDDMLAMAGTLNRLIMQGHDVAVVYLTSGNLGVPDADARWVAEFMLEAGADAQDSIAEAALQDLRTKKETDEDSPMLRRLKGFLRRSEARAALKICALPDDHVTFLDLPFYEQGRYRQFLWSDADVNVLREVIETRRPHQIFFTGSDADPSSVHAKCFQVLRQVLSQLQQEAWLADCWFWQFAAGSREWPLDEVDMAVPCSPDELVRKVQAIYQHRSQMSQMPLVQPDHLELWEQTRARNRATAQQYDQLGLAEYEALECFVKWDPWTT
ncbi:MAG: glucosamine-6-phosphate deaminase [Puniceicoccaceae bacterium]